jgi:hypothetical protein
MYPYSTARSHAEKGIASASYQGSSDDILGAMTISHVQKHIGADIACSDGAYTKDPRKQRQVALKTGAKKSAKKVSLVLVES